MYAKESGVDFDSDVGQKLEISWQEKFIREEVGPYKDIYDQATTCLTEVRVQVRRVKKHNMWFLAVNRWYRYHQRSALSNAGRS